MGLGRRLKSPVSITKEADPYLFRFASVQTDGRKQLRPHRRLLGDLFSSRICYPVYGKGERRNGEKAVQGSRKLDSGSKGKLKFNLNSTTQTQFQVAGVLLPDLLSCICGRGRGKKQKEGRTDGKVTGPRN